MLPTQKGLFSRFDCALKAVRLFWQLSEFQRLFGFQQLSGDSIEKMRAFFSSLEKPSGACTLAYSGMLPLIWI